MKLSLVLAAACLLSLGNVPAWANAPESRNAAMPPTVPVMPQASLMPQVMPQGSAMPETIDSSAVEPAALSTEGSAADLAVEERSPLAPAADRVQAFNLTAEQINQNLANPSEKPSSPLAVLGQAISLPEGMVVRGINRGGVAIGSEIP